MVFFSKVFLLTSFLSIISFAVAELGFSAVPVLYPFGVFLHEYWFADYGERLKAHFGNFPQDGPPLVAVTGTGGGTSTFTYPYPNANDPFNYYITGVTPYDNAIKNSEQYTPVDGLYGVQSEGTVKANSTELKEYYPAAEAPNDYIAKRLLGENALSYTALMDLGNDPNNYNQNVFKSGTPFKAAVIGPGKENDPNWASMPNYTASYGDRILQVPQTTKNTGTLNTNQQIEYVEPQRDYSGNEHASETSLEAKSGGQIRPPWALTDQDGNYIDENLSAAWPGENSQIQAQPQLYPNLSPMIYATFTTPAGAYPVLGTGAYSSGQAPVGWGENYSETPQSQVSPKTQQLDYIDDFLSQPNPIPTHK